MKVKTLEDTEDLLYVRITYKNPRKIYGKMFNIKDLIYNIKDNTWEHVFMRALTKEETEKRQEVK